MENPPTLGINDLVGTTNNSYDNIKDVLRREADYNPNPGLFTGSDVTEAEVKQFFIDNDEDGDVTTLNACEQQTILQRIQTRIDAAMKSAKRESDNDIANTVEAYHDKGFKGLDKDEQHSRRQEYSNLSEYDKKNLTSSELEYYGQRDTRDEDYQASLDAARKSSGEQLINTIRSGKIATLLKLFDD